MNHPQRKLTVDSIQWATNRAKDWCEDYPAKALAMLTDSDKKKRIERQECKSCFYLNTGRIGGAAITQKPCDLCGVEMCFGSTCTDRICNQCSKENELCAFCGGDIHMRVLRRWVLKAEKDKS